jgi:hypothetical protein
MKHSRAELADAVRLMNPRSYTFGPVADARLAGDVALSPE